MLKVRCFKIPMDSRHFFELCFQNLASLARTVASLARTVPEPFPTNSLPIPPGSSAGFRRARSASLMDGLDGVGWDGMGYQKCPSNFFILCEPLDHVHICLYTYSKIVTNILMGFKLRYQFRGIGI